MVRPLFTLYHAVVDPGEGPGGPAPQLFLDQTEARRAEIFFFLQTGFRNELKKSTTHFGASRKFFLKAP